MSKRKRRGWLMGREEEKTEHGKVQMRLDVAVE